MWRQSTEDQALRTPLRIQNHAQEMSNLVGVLGLRAHLDRINEAMSHIYLVKKV